MQRVRPICAQRMVSLAGHHVHVRLFVTRHEQSCLVLSRRLPVSILRNALCPCRHQMPYKREREREREGESEGGREEARECVRESTAAAHRQRSLAMRSIPNDWNTKVHPRLSTPVQQCSTRISQHTRRKELAGLPTVSYIGYTLPSLSIRMRTAHHNTPNTSPQHPMLWV